MAENELIRIVQDSELEEAKARLLVEQFADVSGIVASIDAKAREIQVTSELQTLDMQLARTMRLELRQKRIEIENTRKMLKEQALREGKAIDRVAQWLKGLIEPTEKHLDEQEHFIERKRAAEEEARRIEAEKALREKEAKEAKEREAEQKRMREENARLRKEAEEREKAARKQEEEAAKERAAHEENLRAEREKAERAKKKAAEAAAAKARKEAEEKAVERERTHQEELRLAAMVKCPKCGHEFDSREVK